MIKRYAKLAVGLLLLVTGGFATLYWFTFRIYVPENHCAVLIRKTGDALPSGQLVALKPGERGIQEDVLGPGRYFRNPITWDWEIKPLEVISSGNPASWEWIHSLDKGQRDRLRTGKFQFRGEFPEIGVVVRKVGPEAPEGRRIVDRDSAHQGILREVLTPGTYKINPYVYQVERHPAVVIPAGFVGVVTNLFGKSVLEKGGAVAMGDESSSSLIAGESHSLGADDPVATTQRRLAEPGARGTQRDVLQPGIYFINPKLQSVTLIEIGFNEFSQVKENESNNLLITFPSDTGYQIRVGVIVVWGIDPKHAADVINEFGNVDRVIDKVIEPQIRSICRNIGSTYSARDFIQGERREMFQRDLTAELQRICRAKNIEILIALVREIEVHAPTATGVEGEEVTEDLKRTIQQSHIAIEKQITKDKQREAAAVRAQLEEERKKVEIARENVSAETRVMAADIDANGQKTSAQTLAQADLEVATIQEEVAKLDAQRIEILGRANADVEKLKNGAEAQGYEMLVSALGSGKAYNLYTFAREFKPESIRLFFAGDGTFWTDLSKLEEVGAAKILQSDGTDPKPIALNLGGTD
jgi:regulator of protease activity HflC (stomatin/prohibitin superfamily)